MEDKPISIIIKKSTIFTKEKRFSERFRNSFLPLWPKHKNIIAHGTKRRTIRRDGRQIAKDTWRRYFVSNKDAKSNRLALHKQLMMGGKYKFYNWWLMIFSHIFSTYTAHIYDRITTLIKSWSKLYILLLNKPYVNEVTLRGKNITSFKNPFLRDSTNLRGW